MAALKSQDIGSGDVAVGDVLSEFRGYNLDAMGLPRAARPRTGVAYHGQHGYTLKTPGGAVACLFIFISTYIHLYRLTFIDI